MDGWYKIRSNKGEFPYLFLHAFITTLFPRKGHVKEVGSIAALQLDRHTL
jgi:hypothetical protein